MCTGSDKVAGLCVYMYVCMCLLQMILYYKKHHGSGLPLRHTLTVGLHVAAALWHLHPSIVHR